MGKEKEDSVTITTEQMAYLVIPPCDYPLKIGLPKPCLKRITIEVVEKGSGKL